MFRKPVGLLAYFFLLAVVGPALAQPAAVAAKPPLDLNLVSKTPLLNWYEKRDGKMVCVGTVNLLDVTALEEETDYYRVRWAGRPGWVKRDEVVTPGEALAYFKGRVERDPSDGYAQCLYAYELASTQQPAQAQIAADEAIRLLPNDSRPLQVRARLFFFKGDAKGALDDLNVAVRLDPSNSENYAVRASVIGIVQGRYDEALPDLDKALRLSPNYEMIFLVRSRLRVRRGDYLEAAMDLDRAVRAYPDFVAAHVERAELLSDFKIPAVYNLQEAVGSARRACGLTKWENGIHLRRLARLCDLAGDKEEAVRCREKAKRAEAPQLPQAQPAAVEAKPPLILPLASKTPLLNWYEKRDGQLVCVGTVNVLDLLAFAEEGDYYRVRCLGRQGWVKRDDVVTLSKGIAYFKDRVEREPSDGYAHCMYACVQMYAQQSVPAQVAADEAVRLLPNDSRPRQVRALLFILLKGDLKGALDDLDVAVRLDPSNSQIYLIRATVTGIRQRRYEEALLDLDKALRLTPNDERLYKTRSFIWKLKGDYLEAAMDLDRAIRAYPDYLEAHVDRAELLSDLVDLTVYNLPEAVVSARRACELTKWEDGVHLRRLARLCERGGNKEEAVRCREKAERADTAQLPPLPAAKP